MTQVQTKITITSIAILTFATAHASPTRIEKEIKPKDIVLEISRSTAKTLQDIFKPKVKRKIKELTAQAAESESKFGTQSSQDRNLLAALKEHKAEPKLYVTVQAVSSNGTRETIIPQFKIGDHRTSASLTIPAKVSGKFRNEKTDAIIVSIAPIPNLTDARNHDLVREHEYKFKKLYNNSSLHFSPTDYAAKKYAVNK